MSRWRTAEQADELRARVDRGRRIKELAADLDAAEIHRAERAEGVGGRKRVSRCVERGGGPASHLGSEELALLCTGQVGRREPPPAAGQDANPQSPTSTRVSVSVVPQNPA